MAISIMMTCLRIGAFSGINIIANLIYGNCNFLFILCGAVLFVTTWICYYMLKKVDAQSKAHIGKSRIKDNVH